MTESTKQIVALKSVGNSKEPKKPTLPKSRRWSVRLDLKDFDLLNLRAKANGKHLGTVIRAIVSDDLRSATGRKQSERARRRISERERTEPEYRKLTVAVNSVGRLLNQIAVRLNVGQDPDAGMLRTLKGCEDALDRILREGSDAYLPEPPEGGKDAQ